MHVGWTIRVFRHAHVVQRMGSVHSLGVFHGNRSR
jgi:hypothetical protein